ncbi:MAG: glycyl-radical enzyme activating protein [Chloroflexi bacterium]|nr:glycyl-radical enzyme activating protein [Chloroflexota bacterium]
MDVDRFATHDGPGIRTIVFLKGCSLSCWWCHSPESQSVHSEILYQIQRCTACWLCVAVCPTHALTKGTSRAKEVAVLNRSLCDSCGECAEVCYPAALRLAGAKTTVGALVAKIEQDAPYFRNSGGGITVSGGEPGRQFEFTHNLLLACKERGIHTAMETTGYARWEVLAALAEVTDLLLFDIKFVDPTQHRRYTGVPNRLILDNLRKLAASGREIQVRVPCISGVNDTPEQIYATARLVADYQVKRIALLPYNSAAGAKYEWLGLPFKMQDLETQSEEYMTALAAICRDAGLTVQVGG